jgi:serine/threonine protein kinase
MTPFLVNESTSTLTRVDGADLGIDGLAVVEMIGRGGFGAVYRVRDEAHGRDVAVKVLPALLDDSARRQFDRERRAMGALSDHPGIGTVHTSGFTTNGEPYIAMQLMGGGSLADRIAKGPLAIGDALEIGATMADALAAAHAAGVLHLDIKPENILFTAHGEPKLVDFGIAKLADDTRATSTIRATPAYAAPEVLEGQTATPAADVYSLAVTIYAALMGEAPFSGDSMLTVLRRIAVEPVPVITRLDVPAPIASLLRRAMDKSPRHDRVRWSSSPPSCGRCRPGSTRSRPSCPAAPRRRRPSCSHRRRRSHRRTRRAGGTRPHPRCQARFRCSGPRHQARWSPGPLHPGPLHSGSAPPGSAPPGSPPPGPCRTWHRRSGRRV